MFKKPAVINGTVVEEIKDHLLITIGEGQRFQWTTSMDRLPTVRRTSNQDRPAILKPTAFHAWATQASDNPSSLHPPESNEANQAPFRPV